MAYYIPFEIQAEIMKRLPTRSLMRFRSVSKTWKALIDSSTFIADYNIQQTHQHHLLVEYYDLKKRGRKFFSVVDDDTFPQQKFPLIPSIPGVLGVSQGVFCLYKFETEDRDPQIVLWNPSIRKSIAIDAIKDSAYGNQNVIGFGVCPHTSDPMLVNINCDLSWTYHYTTPHPWQVEVYTLSSRVWRSIPTINRPHKTILLRRTQIAINEFIYWLAIGWLTEKPNYNLIISFDMTNDEIVEVSLPDSLARRAGGYHLALSKLKGSLVVLETVEDAEKQVFNVWMMKRGVPNSFTKLFSLNAPDASIKILHAFRKNNEPVFGARTGSDAHGVFVHELNAEQIYCVVIPGMKFTSYMETLLLHDQ